MKFYAGVHYYGINIANDVHTLVRFDDRAARDAFVNDELPDRNGNYHREALTRDEARRIDRKAFGPAAVVIDAIMPTDDTEEAQMDASFGNELLTENNAANGKFAWLRYDDGTEWYDVRF